MRLTATALLVGSLLLVGCGGDEGGFEASGAWSRPTPATATNGVVYLELSSDIPDVLVGVDVPPDVAARAELSTSDLAGSGGHQHDAGDDDTATMAQVTEIVIDAGASVEFRPGGSHIMLVDLARPLVLGDTFPVTLHFSSDRTLDVTVEISDNPPR